MGFLEALLLIFVVLKLVGAIDWSWGWVLSPLYPAVAIWLLCVGAILTSTFRRWR